MMALNTWNRWSFLRPTVLVWSVFTTLIGICKAQQQSKAETATVLVIALAGGATIIFLCFVAFFATIWYFKRKKNIQTVVLPTTTTQYTQDHNLQTSTRSSFPQSQASDQRSLRYQLQSNVSPLSRVIYLASTPTSNVSNEVLQTVPQASEPVSLPEATLHQGEAPPAYAEAVRMKTVCMIDLPQ